MQVTGHPHWSTVFVQGVYLFREMCALLTQGNAHFSQLAVTGNPFGHKPVLLTPRLPPPPQCVLRRCTENEKKTAMISTEIIHDHGNNHSTQSCSRGQKSPQPISFHISHYYSSTKPSLPHFFKKEKSPHYIWILSPSQSWI